MSKKNNKHCGAEGELNFSGKDKLWGGRFSENTDDFVETFTASVNFDANLARYDIQGSIAHATMLSEVGILTRNEKQLIIKGLEEIAQEIEKDCFTWSISLEDVHMNIESSLIDKIGDIGKKLHTGRSRNDQVATDIRLYLRESIKDISLQLLRLQKGILKLAKLEYDTIMPGFTHLQSAQPITFGHHLMAWFEMLKRDYDRLQECVNRVNVSPLGAAALSGTSYAIDRKLTANLMSFDKVAENSLDAVSDRDFLIEFTSVASIIMMHFSRFSEEIVLWTSSQFDFIELPDRFCTGSSIMPQKKNPDVPELIRGKTGRVYGHLMTLLTLMKGQPLAYNKDNQEDKEPLFDCVITLKDCIRAYADMIPAIKSKKDNMKTAAGSGYATATDLADYLVKKGVPFRSAHNVVGQVVKYAIQENKDLSELTLDELKAFAPEVIDDDVTVILTLEGSVAARDHLGGTAPKQVMVAIDRGQQWLAEQVAGMVDDK